MKSCIINSPQLARPVFSVYSTKPQDSKLLALYFQNLENRFSSVYKHSGSIVSVLFHNTIPQDYKIFAKSVQGTLSPVVHKEHLLVKILLRSQSKFVAT